MTRRKKKQEDIKDLLGDEYQDYNLVFATSFGLPYESASLRKSLDALIKEHDLPKIVFHSLRHTSITYKLKLNGGDIKAVQGDSGHSQVNMVTDVWMCMLIFLMRTGDIMQNFLRKLFTGRKMQIQDRRIFLLLFPLPDPGSP